MSSLIGRSGFPRSTGASVSPVGKTGYSAIQFPQLSPEQYNLFSKLLGGISPGLEKGLGALGGIAGGDQSQFAALEAPALRQHQELLGNIGARFAGMGSAGAQRSSGFQQATTAASTDLAERLQSQRMGLQQQAIRDLLGLGRELLGTKLTDTALIENPQPFWKELLSGLIGTGSRVAGTLGGGYLGSKLGIF